jgi:hypothetical protein
MAYLQYPVLWGKTIGKKMLLKKRAKAKKMATVTFPKNLTDPEFRATTKIMKYKKQKYYG